LVICAALELLCGFVQWSSAQAVAAAAFEVKDFITIASAAAIQIFARTLCTTYCSPATTAQLNIKIVSFEA
jgi:hypothetical protein